MPDFRRNVVELHPGQRAGLRSGGLLAVERQGRGKQQEIRSQDQTGFAHSIRDRGLIISVVVPLPRYLPEIRAST